MAVAAYADPTTLFGTSLPKKRSAPLHGRAFGDVALLVFLIAQCLDGVFTYVGVVMFGIGVEANPIIASAMTHLGPGVGLMGAKVLASGLGICLHIREIHQAVALLSAFYLTVAVAPWTVILFF